jgi:NAD+ kinase
MPMRIGIVSRTDKPEAVGITRKIIDLLRDHEIFIDRTMKDHVELNTIQDVDFIIAIGGDGTILGAVRDYKETPILPVNMGTHGYLTEIKPKDYKKIPSILAKHTIEERSKLVVTKEGTVVGEVLNEVTMRAKKPTKVADFLVQYNDREETISGDGIIVATPTGSTAYSLSAGGPIVHKKAEVIVITPLAPLGLKNIPTVIPDTFTVRIRNRGKDSYLVLDGANYSVLKLDEEIKIIKAKNTAKFVRI